MKKESIPIQRLLFYLLVIGFLPIFFTLSSIYIKKTERQDLLNSLDASITQKSLQNTSEVYNTATRKHFANTDPFYISKELETLHLLEQEKQELEKAARSSFIQQEKSLQKRQSFLSGTSNMLTFSSGKEQSFSNCKEILYTQQQPVEVNVQDIQKILSLVEGKKVGPFLPKETRPHLLLSQFSLKKNEGFLNEVFSLHMQIIQREYEK